MHGIAEGGFSEPHPSMSAVTIYRIWVRNETDTRTFSVNNSNSAAIEYEPAVFVLNRSRGDAVLRPLALFRPTTA